MLALDPGMAFGTGLHPTTRLCLVGIESLADRGALAGARVLDVGCGSGILAIAAAEARGGDGARRRHRPDRDRGDARERATEHARPAARAREGSLPSGERAFDVVLANLIAGVLVSLAPALRDELRPGGSLLASGIFVDREAEVRAAFEAAGLEVTDRSGEGDWVALEAVRRA